VCGVRIGGGGLMLSYYARKESAAIRARKKIRKNLLNSVTKNGLGME